MGENGGSGDERDDGFWIYFGIELKEFVDGDNSGTREREEWPPGL